MDLRFLLLLVCFFVSGFAALLYQTAWTREFAFLFGTSELAVVAVLAAYMGGLALGAAAAARFVGRLARPVLAYGVLELGIAFGALAVPFLIRGVQSVYLGLAGGLEAPPETMALTTALFHLVGSFFVLVPCTALMGATLPLLARYAVSEDAQVGPRIGILYAVNTFGAIAGTLVAAFVLLPALGLRHTVYVGIAGNAVVFLAAAALARGLAGMAPDDSATPAGRGGFHWILPAMLLSGAVSFLYEVLWTRLLGQVLGGSTSAFASMLSSFLLGIALGSALASRFARTRSAATTGFALAQIGSGVLAWLAFRASDHLPEVVGWVGGSAAEPFQGAAAAGAILLPVTLCIGATFPFGVRLLARDADEAAAVSGRVYAWNTVGSIVGSIGAGFFLLPMAGLDGTAQVGIVTSLGLALATALASQPRRVVLAVVATVAIAGVALVGLPRPVNLLLHSAISGGRTAGELFYLGVGRSATVTVVEHEDGWRLLTNGLPESGVERPEMPDLRFNETAWLSLLPTAARPGTADMLIIGLGGAKTLEAVASTVRSIDVIELEEEVVTANRLIPRAIQPLDDPRVHLRLGDARGAMNLSDKRYDAIVSQPSHPWTSGASHLYTRDFFELVHSKLEPGGIFVQWIGAGFVNVELFGSLMAAMSDAFPFVHVYRPVPAAMVFVASDQPIDLLESAPRALAAAPESFGRYGIHRVEDFYASWSLDTAGVRQLAAGRPLNTDDHNRLATTRLPAAERHMGRDAFDASLEVVDVLTPERLAEVDAVAVLRRMAWNGEGRRAHKLARRLPKAQRLAADGWMMFDTGPVGRAQALFRRALKTDPTLTDARDGLVASFAGDALDADSLSPSERTLLAASERIRAQDWAGLTALDDALARVGPGELLFGSAVRARVAWRFEGQDPTRAREAIALIDQLLTRERTPDHYFLRARAGALAGDPAIAWAALKQVVTNGRPRPPLVRAALDLARQLGPPPPGSLVLEQLTLLSRGRR
ncbi:MAG: fused MFS/spermidine synthase [Myxococcota bacterium]